MEKMNEQETHNSFSISHELRPGYLYASIKGDTMSYEIARSYWDEIIALGKRTKSDRVLVEKDIPSPLTTVDRFRLGSELASAAFRQVKLAFCDRYASPEDMSFTESVLSNRGMNVGAFNDVEKAESWLLSS